LRMGLNALWGFAGGHLLPVCADVPALASGPLSLLASLPGWVGVRGFAGAIRFRLSPSAPPYGVRLPRLFDLPKVPLPLERFRRYSIKLSTQPPPGIPGASLALREAGIALRPAGGSRREDPASRSQR
jgi:hypothetical protein